MAKKPVILKVYPSIPRHPNYPLQEFKVRIIKYENSDNLLDIREFITSTIYTGYSPKGTSFTLEQVEYLYSILGDVIEVMRNENDKLRKEIDAESDKA